MPAVPHPAKPIVVAAKADASKRPILQAPSGAYQRNSTPVSRSQLDFQTVFRLLEIHYREFLHLHVEGTFRELKAQKMELASAKKTSKAAPSW